MLNMEMLNDKELVNQVKSIPDRMAFKIGDVAKLAGIKAHVLRYWETEFDVLTPKKSDHNQRMYTKKDVETVLVIKKLLYKDRFSIEGAREALRKLRSEIRKDKGMKEVIKSHAKVRRSAEALIEELRSEELRSLRKKLDL
jgi:DNA-binding transcriptional MerR regulator